MQQQQAYINKLKDSITQNKQIKTACTAPRACTGWTARKCKCSWRMDKKV